MKLDYAGLRLEFTSPDALMVDGQKMKPDVRTAAQMRPVLREIDLPDETPAYFMYRNVTKKEHLGLYEKHSMRFDITILPFLWLGSEYNKTFGHYHPPAPSGVPYAELYEVIAGEAHYLLQKLGKTGIERVFLVKTKAGEKAVMPPGYGHVTINTSEILVMDNIVEAKFKSDYGPYEEKHGAAYYWTKDGLEKNLYYSKLPPLEEVRAPELNKRVNEELAENLEEDNSYKLFLREPKLFEFLVRPELI